MGQVPDCGPSATTTVLKEQGVEFFLSAFFFFVCGGDLETGTVMCF